MFSKFWDFVEDYVELYLRSRYMICKEYNQHWRFSADLIFLMNFYTFTNRQNKKGFGNGKFE